MPIKRSRNTFWVCTAFKIFVVVAEVNEVETIWCLTRWKSSPVVSSLNGLKKRIGLTTFNLGVSLSLILVLALSVKKRKKKKKGVCVCVCVCARSPYIYTAVCSNALNFLLLPFNALYLFLFFSILESSQQGGKRIKRSIPSGHLCSTVFPPTTPMWRSRT